MLVQHVIEGDDPPLVGRELFCVAVCKSVFRVPTVWSKPQVYWADMASKAGLNCPSNLFQVDEKPIASGAHNQVHRGQRLADHVQVIIRRTKGQGSVDEAKKSADEATMEKEVNLMKTASTYDFGPKMYAYGYCASDQDPYFWQAMEFFSVDLHDYMLKFPCNRQDNQDDEARQGRIETLLKQLFLNMARRRMFCMDLKPDNVVVNYKKADGKIENMRLIDFDETFCLQHIDDLRVSVNTLWLSMLLVFSNNSNLACQTKFFQPFLVSVFAGRTPLPVDDGEVSFPAIMRFLEHTNTPGFRLDNLMKYYFAAKVQKSAADVRRMVDDVLRGGMRHAGSRGGAAALARQTARAQRTATARRSRKVRNASRGATKTDPVSGRRATGRRRKNNNAK